MHPSLTRLSLATALLIAGGLPVLAQGSAPVPGPRAAASSPAVVGAPVAPATTQAARPAIPAPAVSTSQAARPATPAQPGGSVRHQAPRQGAAAGHGTGTQQAATPARPATPRIN